MAYQVKRYLGYGPWGVTNPWVFADLAQPQRRRVPSHYIWQTHPPREGMFPLGQVGQIVGDLTSAEARPLRMELYSLIGLGLTAWFVMRSRRITGNKGRRRRGRRR